MNNVKDKRVEQQNGFVAITNLCALCVMLTFASLYRINFFFF